MYLQMAQARGRASRAAEPNAVHETLGLKVRHGGCPRRGPAYCLGPWSPATLSLCLSTVLVNAVFCFWSSSLYLPNIWHAPHPVHPQPLRCARSRNAFNFLSLCFFCFTRCLLCEHHCLNAFSRPSLSFLCFVFVLNATFCMGYQMEEASQADRKLLWLLLNQTGFSWSSVHDMFIFIYHT